MSLIDISQIEPMSLYIVFTDFDEENKDDRGRRSTRGDEKPKIRKMGFMLTGDSVQEDDRVDFRVIAAMPVSGIYGDTEWKPAYSISIELERLLSGPPLPQLRLGPKFIFKPYTAVKYNTYDEAELAYSDSFMDIPDPYARWKSNTTLEEILSKAVYRTVLGPGAALHTYCIARRSCSDSIGVEENRVDWGDVMSVAEVEPVKERRWKQRPSDGTTSISDLYCVSDKGPVRASRVRPALHILSDDSKTTESGERKGCLDCCIMCKMTSGGLEGGAIWLLVSRTRADPVGLSLDDDRAQHIPCRIDCTHSHSTAEADPFSVVDVCSQREPDDDSSREAPTQLQRRRSSPSMYGRLPYAACSICVHRHGVREALTWPASRLN
ncbi:hypothetical protein DFH11DRAFT_1547574 [Phellopilus nigrolimitatus]|nr:hypothetical protein DFH11DRAFT_1547574 [Phellopilus nigrolimitatus]